MQMKPLSASGIVAVLFAAVLLVPDTARADFPAARVYLAPGVLQHGSGQTRAGATIGGDFMFEGLGFLTAGMSLEVGGFRYADPTDGQELTDLTWAVGVLVRLPIPVSSEIIPFLEVGAGLHMLQIALAHPAADGGLGVMLNLDGFAVSVAGRYRYLFAGDNPAHHHIVGMLGVHF